MSVWTLAPLRSDTQTFYVAETRTNDTLLVELLLLLQRSGA